MEYLVNENRYKKYASNPTGLLVRAKMPDGTWDNVDVNTLELDSVIAWLKSRGGNNPWAEEVVTYLLGYW